MVKILKADASSLVQCVEALCKGKAIIYPTETVYGLGVDALNKKAVSDLLMIKREIQTNPSQ